MLFAYNIVIVSDTRLTPIISISTQCRPCGSPQDKLYALLIVIAYRVVPATIPLLPLGSLDIPAHGT
jgi:hypothetical protein